MKTYCELYFRAPYEGLKKFIDKIQTFATGNWSVEVKEAYPTKWIQFNYTGDCIDRAAVCINIGNSLQEGEMRVTNIVPLEKSKLSMPEYNSVLKLFYEEIIRPNEASYPDIVIQLTNDEFDPRAIISDEALIKLKAFCDTSNKTTGSVHPTDQEKWFDFICQTVDDGRIFDLETLAEFLQDESYWGKREEGFLGSVGDFAWDKERAWGLAAEYEKACEILQYYKRTR